MKCVMKHCDNPVRSHVNKCDFASACECHIQPLIPKKVKSGLSQDFFDGPQSRRMRLP